MKIYSLIFEGRTEDRVLQVKKELISSFEEEDALSIASELVELDETKGKSNAKWAALNGTDLQHMKDLIYLANVYADNQTRARQDPAVPSYFSEKDLVNSIKEKNQKRIQQIGDVEQKIKEIAPEDIVYESESMLVVRPSRHNISTLFSKLAISSNCIFTHKTSRFFDMYNNFMEQNVIINRLLPKSNPESLLIVSFYPEHFREFITRDIQRFGYEGVVQKIKQNYYQMENDFASIDGSEPRPFPQTDQEVIETLKESLEQPGRVREIHNSKNEKHPLRKAKSSLLAVARNSDDLQMIKYLFE